MDPRSPGSPRSVALAILCFIFLGACAREEPPAAAARQSWGVVADVKIADGDTQWFAGPRISW